MGSSGPRYSGGSGRADCRIFEKVPPQFPGKKSPAEAGPRAFAEGGSLDFRSGTIPSAGIGSRKKKPRRMTGLKTVMHGATQGHSNKAPPVHIRGPTRPNWGGGGSLFGYNFLGHDALTRALCKPRPALRLHAAGRDYPRSNRKQCGYDAGLTRVDRSYPARGSRLWPCIGPR